MNPFSTKTDVYLDTKENQLHVQIPHTIYNQHYIDSDYICTKENGILVTPISIKWHAEKIKKEMGIDFNFHSFRHTHATLLLEIGTKIKAIQERLGHSKISTKMDTYSHITKKTRKETVDLFENLMKTKNFHHPPSNDGKMMEVYYF